MQQAVIRLRALSLNWGGRKGRCLGMNEVNDKSYIEEFYLKKPNLERYLLYIEKYLENARNDRKGYIEKT